MAAKRFGLRSTFSQTVGGEVFQGRDEFEGGLLHKEREVIEMMVWIIAPRQGRRQLSMVESAKIVSQALSEHWIWSNVYPKKLQNVQNQIDKLFKEFKKLQATAQVKQTDNWRKDMLNPFLERIRKGLDISTYDGEYLAKPESKYGPFGIKMTEEDMVYRDDQVSGLRQMYCQSFADKRWLANVERRKKEELIQFLAKELTS